MQTYTITQEQMDAIKEAQKALKDYNELTAMGLGFNSEVALGFMSMFTPKMPANADGPYPTGIKVAEKLNRLFGPIKE